MTDITKQNEQIERLRAELERLNGAFEQAKRAMGLPEGEEVKVSEAEMTPEMKTALEAAKQKAEADARNAVAALKSEEPAKGAARRGRRGAISI